MRVEKGSKSMAKKRIFGSLVISLCCMLLGGCQTTELEERGFPLALAIDKSEQGMVVSFDFPDLSVVSDGKAADSSPMGFSVEAGAYYEAQKAYENNSNNTLDYNHLKAILISQDFLADREAVQDLLAWLEGEEVLARNTCLFAAKDKSSSLLTLTEKTSGSVGKYLERMAESQKDFKNNKLMTIGKLMNQWHNQNELLLIPVVTEEGGIPAITEYAVVDAFSYKGNISVEDAMKAFLAQGLLSSFTYQMNDNSVLEIEDIKTNVQIGEQEESGLVKISITGKAYVKKEGKNGAVSAGKRKKQLKSQLQESLQDSASRVQRDLGIDMTGSYRLLGGMERSLYEAYDNQYEAYNKNVQTEFSVDITVINE